MQGEVIESVFALGFTRRVGSALLARNVQLGSGIVLDGAACSAAVSAVMLRASVSVAVIGAVDEVPNGRHILGVRGGVLADERLAGLLHLLDGLGALVGGYGGDWPAASGGDTLEAR